MKQKKITLATVKSFIKKNKSDLYINIKSSFDGMVDGCVSQHDGFKKIDSFSNPVANTMGITGAWFVLDSRDYFNEYLDENYQGFTVSNSCGRFIISTTKK